MTTISSIRVTESTLPNGIYPLIEHPMFAAATAALQDGTKRIDVESQQGLAVFAAAVEAAEDQDVKFLMCDMSFEIEDLARVTTATNIGDAMLVLVGMEKVRFRGMTHDESVTAVEQLVAVANPKLLIMVTYIK